MCMSRKAGETKTRGRDRPLVMTRIEEYICRAVVSEVCTVTPGMLVSESESGIQTSLVAKRGVIDRM